MPDLRLRFTSLWRRMTAGEFGWSSMPVWGLLLKYWDSRRHATYEMQLLCNQPTTISTECSPSTKLPPL